MKSMKLKQLALAALTSIAVWAPQSADATKFLRLKVVDKDYLMIHFRDGEVRYRDDATGKVLILAIPLLKETTPL